MEQTQEVVAGRGKIRTDFAINIPTLIILLGAMMPIYFQFFQLKQNTENIEANRQAIIRVEQKIDTQTRAEIEKLRDEITNLKVSLALLEGQKKTSR